MSLSHHRLREVESHQLSARKGRKHKLSQFYTQLEGLGSAHQSISADQASESLDDTSQQKSRQEHNYEEEKSEI